MAVNATTMPVLSYWETTTCNPVWVVGPSPHDQCVRFGRQELPRGAQPSRSEASAACTAGTVDAQSRGEV